MAHCRGVDIECPSGVCTHLHLTKRSTMKLTFRRGMASVATAALTLGVATTATPAFAENGDSDEFVLYVTNWGEMDTLKRLHDSEVANYVTTINYAFGDVAPRDLTRDGASGHPDIPCRGTGLVDWQDCRVAEP